MKDVTGVEPLKTLLVRFARNESGATAIEYALIASLVSVAIVAGAMALGSALDSSYQSVADAVPAVDG